MTAPELKPCPFCGGPAHIRDDSCHSTAFYIGCSKLGCFGSEQWEETQAEAIAGWNTRADTAAAQVAAAYERGAELFDEKHHVFMVAKGRNPSDYMSEFSNAADKLRALATDTQTNALEQVRKEAALKALADMGQEWDADIAAAQVAAAYERAADLCVDQFQAHLDLVITGNPDNARNRESAANMAEKLSHEIRALATDTQTDALEQVRREAEQAGYERGVRDAIQQLKDWGEHQAVWTLLALLDNPTPDPDEQTEAAQELAFRKAVSS